MIEGIFIDRDGTINVERADYVKSWEELTLLPGVLDALRDLARLDAPIVVVTNQSAIGRGLTSRATVDLIHRRLQQVIAKAGGRIDAFYVCPHLPEDGCACRKPKAGLLLKAAHDLGLDASRCLMIGDTFTDYEAARAAGSLPILVKSGRQGPQLALLLEGNPDAIIVDHLQIAANLVLTQLAGESTQALPASTE